MQVFQSDFSNFFVRVKCVTIRQRLFHILCMVTCKFNVKKLVQYAPRVDNGGSLKTGIRASNNYRKEGSL
jgi:hypothetical protein